MKYNFLFNNELKLSEVCPGIMTFGEQTSKKDAFKILDFSFHAKYGKYKKYSTKLEKSKKLPKFVKKINLIEFQDLKKSIDKKNRFY